MLKTMIDEYKLSLKAIFIFLKIVLTSEDTITSIFYIFHFRCICNFLQAKLLLLANHGGLD